MTPLKQDEHPEIRNADSGTKVIAQAIINKGFFLMEFEMSKNFCNEDCFAFDAG